MKIEEQIRKEVDKIIQQAGYKLDEVIYEKQGNNGTLTIVIDKMGIVDIDDCVKVTNIVSPILDELDPIKESYVLDVCSKEKGSE